MCMTNYYSLIFPGVLENMKKEEKSKPSKKNCMSVWSNSARWKLTSICLVKKRLLVLKKKVRGAGKSRYQKSGHEGAIKKKNSNLLYNFV